MCSKDSISRAPCQIIGGAFFMSIQSRITGVITLLFIFGPTVVGIWLIQHGNEITGFLLALFSLFFGAIVLFMKIIQKHTGETTQEKNKLITDEDLRNPEIPFGLPQDEEFFNRWKNVYSVIKPLREQKRQWKEVILIIQNNYPDWPHDEKTLRNILKAGDAECLDVYPPNLEKCRKKEQALKQQNE
jgi:hypothetical protein